MDSGDHHLSPAESAGIAPSSDWRLLDADCGFYRSFGPVFFKEAPDDHLILGWRCAQRHLNPGGICHGAALAAFADYAPLGAQYRLGFERIVVPTITLTVDLLHAVFLDDWLEARIEVTSRSGKMCHTQMVAYVGERAVLSSRGIFKLSNSEEILQSPFFQQLRNLWPRSWLGQ
ncbi:hotdog domain-containing protein [Rhizobium leguminosarum]|uniref:PaaI family thioesterase n=1 Tax=Rhizobium leguminosarum TaxID=384 RepID=UPI0024A985E0|nr:hotdog domain-containing protein [Rhizobium leguminosarum]MDI5930000.1 hotdog domain-containing protein [Rhizobium leguminosarum]